MSDRKVPKATMAATRKRHLKSQFCSTSNIIGLIPTLSIRQMLIANSSGVEFKRLYQSSGKEKESRCLVLTGPRPSPSLLSRDLNQRQRRRQQQRQKTIGFMMSKTTALHVHHAF